MLRFLPCKVKKLAEALAWGFAGIKHRHISSLSRNRRRTSLSYSVPEATRPEIYLPSDVWDSQNPVERYASVGDLCAHIGDQLPMYIVKRIARDVLRALAYMHEINGKAHGDLNQDCILISPRNMKALISYFHGDGGDEQSQQTTILQPSETSQPGLISQHTTNVQSSETSHSDTTSQLSTNTSEPSTVNEESFIFRLCYAEAARPRHDPFCDSFSMRPPEALLDAPRSIHSDMWTLGCVLYELLTGESLFDPFFQTVELGLTPEESHLIQIIELLGEFPQDFIKSAKNGRKWFQDDGSLRLETTYFPTTLEEILELRVPDSSPSEIEETADILGAMLRLRPNERARAADLIYHAWFADLDD